MAEKSKIEIKPENKGKFSEHCRRKGYEGVTNECIEKGLASKSASLRKQANFARNSKLWGKGK